MYGYCKSTQADLEQTIKLHSIFSEIPSPLRHDWIQNDREQVRD